MRPAEQQLNAKSTQVSVFILKANTSILIAGVVTTTTKFVGDHLFLVIPEDCAAHVKSSWISRDVPSCLTDLISDGNLCNTVYSTARCPLSRQCYRHEIEGEQGQTLRKIGMSLVLESFKVVLW